MALLIYVDESGDILSLDNKNPYIISSVIIPEKKINYIESKFSKLLHSINKMYKLKIEEIHTKYIVKGNLQWRNISIKDRANILIKIAKTISTLEDIKLYVFAITSQHGSIKSIKNDKNKIKQKFKKVSKLFIENIQKEIINESNIVVIVFDSKTFHQDSIVRKSLEDYIKQYNKLHSSKLYLTFSYSEIETGIQIADYVAYIIRQIVNNQISWRGFNFQTSFSLIQPKIIELIKKDIGNI